jgi:hypothetical protein
MHRPASTWLAGPTSVCVSTATSSFAGGDDQINAARTSGPFCFDVPGLTDVPRHAPGSAGYTCIALGGRAVERSDP